MSDKYLKEIAKELKLIRKELQKMNRPIAIEYDGSKNEVEVMKWGDDAPIFIREEQKGNGQA